MFVVKASTVFSRYQSVNDNNKKRLFTYCDRNIWLFRTVVQGCCHNSVASLQSRVGSQVICVCFGFHRLLLSFFAIHCWHHPLWGLCLIIHLCVIFKALIWSRLCTVHPHLAWKCPLCISCGFIYLNLCLCSLSMLCCCCCISLCCSNLLCACFELRLHGVLWTIHFISGLVKFSCCVYCHRVCL